MAVQAVVAEVLFPAPATATPTASADGLDWKACITPSCRPAASWPSWRRHRCRRACRRGRRASRCRRQAGGKNWDGVDRREERPDVRHAAPVKEDSIRVDAVKLDALLEVAGESVQVTRLPCCSSVCCNSNSKARLPP